MRDPGDTPPTPENKAHPPASAAERLAALFDGHPGAHGTHGVPVRDGNKWGIKTTARTLQYPATVALWERHLAGKRPLGIVSIKPDSTCIWGSIDVDRYDDKAELLEIVNRVIEAKMPLVPCRSKSGGLHLFIFLSAPMPAGVVQAALTETAKRLGLAGSEIFPKQTQLGDDDTGNWMVMPYFGSTYDGKIFEQIGLRRDGTGMPLAEFLEAAEAARVAPAAIDQLAGKGPGPRLVLVNGGGAPTDVSGWDFKDGPPCLEKIAQAGVGRQGRNNVLFDMGVYARKKHGDAGWQGLLDDLNRRFMLPPLDADEVVGLRRSLKKKNYDYLCKDCNRIECGERTYGKRNPGFVVITLICRQPIEPPVDIVSVAEFGDLQFEGAALLSNKNFVDQMWIKFKKAVPRMKDEEWRRVIEAAPKRDVEAPPGLGDDGRFRELIEEFCVNRSAGTRREDIQSGRPWLNPDDGFHYFRMKDFQKFIAREVAAGDPFRKRDRGWLGDQVKKLGGGHKRLKISGASPRNEPVYRVPQFDPAPDLPTSEFKDVV
jgi:hypothetical protein